MKIKCTHTELIDIDLLVPHPRNPNKHSEKQIRILAKILKHQGWRHPVIVSNLSGFIVAGHGRLDAARLNGWDKVPIERQDFKDQAEEYAFLVSDNAIQELSELDKGMINADIGELGPDFDIDLLGVDGFELDLSDTFELDESSKNTEQENKYIIEVHFPNDMEMNDIKDDLMSRGYIVKVK